MNIMSKPKAPPANYKSNNVSKIEWLSSTEMKKQFKISSCELMHRRVRGDFQIEKRGNAYFYGVLEKDYDSQI